jgi:hypothetical protein
MSVRLPGHPQLLRDCEAIPTAHAAWVAAGRKAWGRWFCGDFQVAKFRGLPRRSELFSRRQALRFYCRFVMYLHVKLPGDTAGLMKL